jgi:hypothetical protein
MGYDSKKMDALLDILQRNGLSSKRIAQILTWADENSYELRMVFDRPNSAEQADDVDSIFLAKTDLQQQVELDVRVIEEKDCVVAWFVKHGFEKKKSVKKKRLSKKEIYKNKAAKKYAKKIKITHLLKVRVSDFQTNLRFDRLEEGKIERRIAVPQEHMNRNRRYPKKLIEDAKNFFITSEMIILTPYINELSKKYCHEIEIASVLPKEDIRAWLKSIFEEKRRGVLIMKSDEPSTIAICRELADEITEHLNKKGIETGRSSIGEIMLERRPVAKLEIIDDIEQIEEKITKEYERRMAVRRG